MGAPSSLSSDVYRREARKLYTLADTLPFGQIRNELIEIARQYEFLARHAAASEKRTTTDLPDAPEPPAAAGLVPER